MLSIVRKENDCTVHERGFTADEKEMLTNIFGNLHLLYLELSLNRGADLRNMR